VPTVHGERAAAPGLRFVGYIPRPGHLGKMGKEGARAAKAIARELRGAPPASTAAADDSQAVGAPG
jgi:D-serine deaminase-like pyridoxal phosphate-dependent protein